MNMIPGGNLTIIAIAIIVALILAFLLLRPRQRVRLSDDGVPKRPHMARSARTGEGHGVADEAAAAASDVAGEILGTKVHAQLPGASGPPDDLEKLKGVGPRFAELLNARGIIRFEQLARLSPEESERLDSALGPFRGRLARDRVIDQADYLARGDIDGYEARFGKL